MRSVVASVSSLLWLSFSCIGQTRPTHDYKKAMDSVKLYYLSEAATRYPILRPVSVSTDVIGNSSIHSNLHGKSFFDGKIHSARTTVNINLPVISWGKNSITFSVGYLQQRISLFQVKSYNTALPVSNNVINRGTASFAFSYGRTDSLFGKPVIYSVAVIGSTSEASSVQQLALQGTMLFILKRTSSTALSLGATIIHDPSLSVPVIPVVNYWHKFKSGTELYADLPQRVMVRQQFSPKAWIMLGTELGGSLTFFTPKSQYLPQNINYSTLELKSGLTLEYRIFPKIIISCKGGLINPISSRSFKQGELSNDYIIDNNIKMAPFINLSVSILPFLKPFFH